jgi:imidazolonepropionase-like amidohydrolase
LVLGARSSRNYSKDFETAEGQHLRRVNVARQGWQMQKSLIRGCAGVCLALAASLLLFAVRAIHAQGGEPRCFAIQNARIVPVSGAPIESGTVVVANGLIKAVGANVSIPPEAFIIDGKGLTVYPGLFDAMAEFAPQAEAPPPQATVGGGRGGPRPVPTEIANGPEDRPGTKPWVVASDELNPKDKRFETWRDGGFTTALAVPRGGMIQGQGSVIDFAGDRAGDMVIKSPATLDLSMTPAGSSFSYPGSLMGVIAYDRQVFIDARWYEQAQSVYNAHPAGVERPKYDRSDVVIGQSLRNKELVLFPANTQVQILRALRLIKEWDLNGALYGAQQAYGIAGAIAAAKLPVLVNLKWPERSKDADPDAEQDLRELRLRDRAPGTPAALAKAGVKFAFYSDGVATPKDALKSVKKAIDAGLAPDAALRALTLGPAEIYGVSDRVGSIEPGKIANLVVTDGDLFNEKTKIKEVFVDGRRFKIREPERPKEPEKPGEPPKKIEAGESSAAADKVGGVR